MRERERREKREERREKVKLLDEKVFSGTIDQYIHMEKGF
jgi:hypothetical protein